MTDRLSLIKARHAEAGGGDGDKAWLIEEVKRLRAALGTTLEPLTALELSVRWELADDVRKAIHGAIRTGQMALGLPT